MKMQERQLFLNKAKLKIGTQLLLYNQNIEQIRERERERGGGGDREEMNVDSRGHLLCKTN